MATSDVMRTSIRFWHIVSVNTEGKVIGYTTLHATKEFRVLPRSEKAKLLDRIDSGRTGNPGERVYFRNKLLKELVRKKLFKL